MLPRKNRISRKEFPSHNVKGIRVFSPLFTAVFYKREAKETAASVVISKKTAKLAVERNRLRRRFYDLLAPYIKAKENSFVVVVYPKKEAIKSSLVDLKNEVEKAFKQRK